MTPIEQAMTDFRMDDYSPDTRAKFECEDHVKQYCEEYSRLSMEEGNREMLEMECGV